MTEKSFSKMVSETERILGFKNGTFQKHFRCISWGDFGFCNRLDQSARDFSSIDRRRYDLKETRLNYLRNNDEMLDQEIKEIFDAIGFMFSLLVHFEKNNRDYVENFAARAPSEFEAWMIQRQASARRSRLKAVK